MFPLKKKSKKQVAAIKSKGKGKPSARSTSKAGSKPPMGAAARIGATMMQEPYPA